MTIEPDTISAIYLCKLCGAQLRGEELDLTPLPPPPIDSKRRTVLATPTGKVSPDLKTRCPESPDGRHQLSSVVT